MSLHHPAFLAIRPFVRPLGALVCSWRVAVHAACLLVVAPFLPLPIHDPSAAHAASITEEIQLITLENGLRIYVLERPFAPTFAAYYQFQVGGAVDPKGRSGIAHLLEHMMFKGTKSIGTTDYAAEAKIMKELSELWHELDALEQRAEDPFHPADPARIEEVRARIDALTAQQKTHIVKNEYDEIFTRAGGVGMNASTGNDVTRYYLSLPKNQLELWFSMEADRLLNPVFREFYSERDVVHEERRLRVENRAAGLSNEAINRMIYQAHPYGTPVIGWPDDIARLKREDAENYFKLYYSPSNCVMVLVGDVRAPQIETLARKYLSKWERQDLPALQITAEPGQRGVRRQSIEHNSEPQIMLGWRTVPEGHADAYALDVLSSILGGMSSSRLDQGMVQRDRVASNVFAYNATQRYGGDFGVGASPRGESTVQELEAAILAEVARIKEEGVTAEEVERAKVSAEVSRVRRLESNMWLARSIGNAVGLTGSPAYMDEYEERLRAVTAAQVQDVARRYLDDSHLNVVDVVKVEDPGSSGGRSRGGDAHARGGEPGERGGKHSTGFAAALKRIDGAEDVQIQAPEIGRDVERVELPSGITVFIKEKRDVPVVRMDLTFLGGTGTLPVEDLAPTALGSDLLNEGGTASLTPHELEVRRDELGLSFSLYMGGTQSGGSFWSLSRNFDESFDLAVDILTQPRFDADRLDVLKGQYIQQEKRVYDNPGAAVSRVASRVLTGDHPRLGRVIAKEEIESLTPASIRAIYDRYLGRDNLYVTVVGDFDRTEMLELLEAKLGSWKTAQDTERDWVERDPSVKPGVFVVEKDLPQPAVRIEQEMAIDRGLAPEDHAAIEILNDILGGSGFRSRLMERLRSDEGLTYGIRSGWQHEGRPGVPGGLTIQYQTRKDAVAHSISSVMEEYERIRTGMVSASELQEQIQAWRNRFIFQYDNEFSSVARLMANELDERPYDHDAQQLAFIQKVTAEHVLEVAQRYLDPSKASIFIFGSLTAEDAAELEATYGLTVMSRDDAFPGGYFDDGDMGAREPGGSR